MFKKYKKFDGSESDIGQLTINVEVGDHSIPNH